MAYRASTKQSNPIPSVLPSEQPLPKNVKEPDMEVPPTKANELSIDALIGGPLADKPISQAKEPVEKQSEEPIIVSSVLSAMPSTPPSISSQTQAPYEPREQGYGRPQSGGQGGGYNRFSRGGYSSQGQPYNQGGQGGGPASHSASLGGYRPGQRFGNNQYRRPQRDFSQTEGGMAQDINVPTETVKGILDIMPEGHGFLRPKFTPSDRDVYISQSQIRRFLLRNGDEVTGQARQPKDNERYWGLLKVEKINMIDAEGMKERPRFDDLIPIYPSVHLKLETGPLPLSTRIIDLLSPIGFGQRGLIVSPPKAGKTTILKEIATGITANYPNVHLMAALIGERPEEVTDLTRNIKGEVLSSNFDQSPQEQVRVAEVALDRAKRLVENGMDVVILLDSVTRLARAYNMVVNPSGRTLSGGFDPAALYPAKKFLGAARCIEATLVPGEVPSAGSGQVPDPAVTKTNGSLTVIGTCLIETGSRMDDLIYEEFKGTGNMELHLSRKLQERRIFPAIDIATSGTRHDELMIGEEAMKKVITLRHMLALLSDDEQTAMMIERLGKTKSNEEFVESLNQG